MGNSVSHWKNKWSWNWSNKRGSKRSSKRGSKGSNMGRWEMKASVEKELRLSISLTLVKTVDRLIAVARERAGITRCKVWSVGIRVCKRGIVVQGIGFRLSQAKRGYGENYDHALHACCWTAV